MVGGEIALRWVWDYCTIVCFGSSAGTRVRGVGWAGWSGGGGMVHGFVCL